MGKQQTPVTTPVEKTKAPVVESNTTVDQGSNSEQQAALQQSSAPSTTSAPSTPNHAQVGEQKATQEAPGQAAMLLKRFDWTTGDAANARSVAIDAYTKAFAPKYAECAASMSAKAAGKQARKAGGQAVLAALEPLAKTLAETRANAALGDGSALSALDSDSKDAVDAYEAGTTGAKAKHYATALNGKSADQMASLLDSDETGTRSDSSLGNGKPQWSWSFTDDSLVRVKPDGDAFGDEPMFCVEVLKANTSASGQDAVAFKTDNAGKAVPKGPGDVANPYDQGKHKPQFEAYQGVMIRAGHRQAASS